MKNNDQNTAWILLEENIEKRKQELVGLIRELVQRPSDVSEKDCQIFIRDWLQERKLECDLWDIDAEKLSAHPAWVDTGLDYSERPNLVSILKGTGGGRSLSLLGHVDVVPVEEPQSWVEKDPWSGALVDGKIYGRGSLDMKAGLAIGLFLTALVKELDIPLEGDLILQSVIDEENGGNGTLAAVERGYRADASIFLEPSGGDYMGISGRGAQFFRITVPGVSGGIEYQFENPNAIGKAMLIYQAVEVFAQQINDAAKHPLYADMPTKVPCAICKIQAGNWASTTPAACVMEGSLECLPGEDIEDRKQQFKDHLLKTAAQDKWLKEHPPLVEWFGLRFESAEIPVDSPIITCVRAASRNVLGKDVLPVGAGGSDLRLPVLYADSPCILYGPKGGAIHSTNEYVEVDSVLEIAKVIGKVILDWCG